MRRVSVILALLMVPAPMALAADLGELLERSGEASFSAEQVITCSTPGGVRSAVVSITQHGNGLVVGASPDGEVQVTAGGGGWSLSKEGAVVSSAIVEDTERPYSPRYTVDEGEPVRLLGREATVYRMSDQDQVRAELVFDDQTGALLQVVTFSGDGAVYCERRFIEFAPGVAMASSFAADLPEGVTIEEAETPTGLPETLAGFDLIDIYQDEGGIVFAYYSDGFFSFAVFETPAPVPLDGATVLDFGNGPYQQAFGPGQVTYSWEAQGGGLALIGDLPPDMHQEVLSALPAPYDPGFLRRLWRSLFG